MRFLIFLLFLLPLSLIGQVESQFNGTLNVFSGTRIGSTNTFTISGIFNSTTTSYTSSQSDTGDIVQVQSGARFYWMHIYSIASNAGGVITCNVRDSSSTLTTFPLGKWSLFRPTTNLRLPLSPDGETNASRSSTFNTLALRVDEIQTAVASATNCEQTFTKASHGFRKGTPVFWNGSTYIRPTADSLVPDFVVVDSLTVNTFKVANCGTYTTSLANGLYWFTSASPGYSLTADTTKVPLFQALNGKLILNPIVGFNLMSGGGAGDVTRDELADSTAAIRADFPSGGVTDGDKGDIAVTSSGATWTIDNGVVTSAKIASQTVDSLDIKNRSITTVKIEDNAITSSKVASQTLDSVDVKNRGITLLKLAQSGATNGQIPKYNSTTGNWEPAADNTGSGSISGLTTNKYPVATGSTSIGDGIITQSSNGIQLDATKDFIGDTVKVNTTSTYTNSAGDKSVFNVNGFGTFKSTSAYAFENIKSGSFGSNLAHYNVLSVRHASTSGASAISFLNAAGYETGAVGYASPSTLVGFINDAVYLNASPHYSDATYTRPQPARLVLGQEGVWSGTGTLLKVRRFHIDTNWHMQFLQPGQEIIMHMKPNDGWINFGNSNNPLFPYHFRKNGLQKASTNLYSVGAFVGSTSSFGVELGYNNSTQSGIVAAANSQPLELWTHDGSGYSSAVTIGTSGFPMTIERSKSNAGLLKLRNTSTGGYTSFEFFGDDGNQKSAIGFGNSGTIAGLSGRTYFSHGNSPIIFTRDNSTATLWLSNTIRAVGIGTTTPTARLQIEAGTATASTAPLKFTSGTNLTTAEAGAIEYDGTEFYATNSTASRTILARVLKGSATLDFGSTAAGAVTDLTITVTGASDGDVVSLSVPNASQTTTGSFSAWVSATNTVTVRYRIAALTGSEDPASGTFKVTVTK